MAPAPQSPSADAVSLPSLQRVSRGEGERRRAPASLGSRWSKGPSTAIPVGSTTLHSQTGVEGSGPLSGADLLLPAPSHKLYPSPLVPS